MIWVILACILAALVLISLIRVGVRAEYDGGQLTVHLRAGPAALRVYPLKQKKKKPEKSQKPKPQKEREEAEPGTGEKLSLLWELLPVALRAAGSLRRKISVDLLEAHILLAGSDPASVAVAYGSTNAIIGMVLPLLEQNFHIRQRDIRTAADFQQTHSEVQAKAALSLTVGQGVTFALRFGWQALGVLLRWRRQNETEKTAKHTTERAVPYGKEPSHQ